MLGGGNPVGGSFTGSAQALEIIGDHAYAYSGSLSVNDTEADLLSFQTGNFYFVGQLQPLYASSNAGDNYKYRIYFNDVFVLTTQIGGALDYSPYEELEVIIPPYTKFRCTADNISDTSSNDVMVAMTGRIYRTRD